MPPIALEVDGEPKVLEGVLGKLLSRAGVLDQEIAGMPEWRAA